MSELVNNLESSKRWIWERIRWENKMNLNPGCLWNPSRLQSSDIPEQEIGSASSKKGTKEQIEKE